VSEFWEYLDHSSKATHGVIIENNAVFSANDYIRYMLIGTAQFDVIKFFSLK